MNVPELRSRAVTISTVLVWQNLERETWKNQNYLVANSELGLAIYAYDSRRNVKETHLLCRVK